MPKQTTALQCLSEMCAITRRLQYPTNPYIHSIKYIDKTANGLENSICKFITLAGYQCERIKNVGRKIEGKSTNTAMGVLRGKSIYIPGTGTRGTPDCRATIKGQSVGIEVKIGKDEQSEHQSQYEKDMVNAGGRYYIAKDFTTFVKWYCSIWGVPELLKQSITNLKKK